MCDERIQLRVFLLSGVVCTLVGCQTPVQEARQYELRGQILTIRREANEVLIKHGDIENFMPGMTMPFKVKEPTLLEGKAPGDLVTATLMVGERDAWIATLDKTGSAPLTETASIPPASFVKPLEPGDVAPLDAVLMDQDGREFSLAAYRGSAVVVTFIYIRCPLPQFCPLMDRRFIEIQQSIETDAALRDRARLLSVSFDPDADTPPRMKAHAEKLGANPRIWRMATAPRDVVDTFAATFGVNVIREKDQTITHNLRTAVIGPDGTVVSAYNGSDWTPAQVVADLRRTWKQ